MRGLTTSIINEIKDLIRKYNCNNCNHSFGIIEGEPTLPPEKKDPKVLLDTETGNIWYWNGNRWGVSGEDILNQVTYNGVTYTEYSISGWDKKLAVNDSNICTTIKAIISEKGNTVNLNWLDVSGVTKMGGLFGRLGCKAGGGNFNGDISQWDTSNVTQMHTMFNGATLFNQDISNWNVSKVTNMLYMFEGATSFNQDISGWNVSKVANMSYMFKGATSFNQDLSGWCVTLINTKPTDFDLNAGFANNSSIQPQWGTCP